MNAEAPNVAVSQPGGRSGEIPLAEAHRRVWIFETHPVQYRAPLYRELARLAPGRILVVYGASRNPYDAGFRKAFDWDEPLLDGYPWLVAGRLFGGSVDAQFGLWPAARFFRLWRFRPAAVVLTGFGTMFQRFAWGFAAASGMPLAFRVETNDRAFPRGGCKSAARGPFYRALYAPAERAFAIGRLNAEHLRRHGVPEKRIMRTPYSVPDRFARMDLGEKRERRARQRAAWGVPEEACVAVFVGKFSAKKNPGLLLRAWPFLQEETAPFRIVFVGSGELESELRNRAKETGTKARFAGFKNQTELPDVYLGADALVLPSRQAGETWGLVVNEALQAGCAAIISEHVGCAPDFNDLERVHVVRDDDARGLGEALRVCARRERSFDWARPVIERFSPEASARTMAGAVREWTDSGEAI